MSKKKSSRPRLWIEITVVVSIKIGLLFLAKALWFSHPIAKHMQVDPAQVQQQFFGQPSH